jgi:lipid A 3-O-deacylase
VPAPYGAAAPYPSQAPYPVPYPGQAPYPAPYPGQAPYPAPYPSQAPYPAPAPPYQAPQTVSERPAAPPAQEERAAFGFISDVRLGVLIHDAGVFGRRKEESEDVNLELTFVSPDILGFLWSPRPHLGVTINTSGDTSQAYAGVTWEFRFWRSFFFDFSFGLSVHDGETETTELDRKELGSRVLFREAIDLGWNFYKRDSISFFIDHVSHGGILADQNEGLDTMGVRYIYRF